MFLRETFNNFLLPNFLSVKNSLAQYLWPANMPAACSALGPKHRALWAFPALLCLAVFASVPCPGKPQLCPTWLYTHSPKFSEDQPTHEALLMNPTLKVCVSLSHFVSYYVSVYKCLISTVRLSSLRTITCVLFVFPSTELSTMGTHDKHSVNIVWKNEFL